MWRLPLLPWLSLVTVGTAAVALIGWRMRRADLALPGTVAAVVAAVAAVILRDQTYVPRSFVVTSFGALLALALVVGWWLTAMLAARDGIPRELTARGFVTTVAVGLLASRVGHVVLAGGERSGLAHALDLRSGGLYGDAGLLAGWVALVLFLHVSEVDWQRAADAASPALAVGLVVTSVGGYLSGSGFGRVLGDDAPIWMRALGTYPCGSTGPSPVWLEQVESGLIDRAASASVPVHPTQLYLALGMLLVGAAMVRIRRARRFHGQVFLTLVFGYGIVRIIVDTWRADPQRYPFGPEMAPAPALGMALLLLAGAFVLGPSRTMVQSRWRHLARAVCLSVPVGGYLAATGIPGPAQASFSQLAALGSVSAAAWAWSRWHETRATYPEAGRLSSSEHPGERPAP
jgi:phosphatidylglycerol:prolipoprotein diacylglycerol transferase